MGVEIKEHLMSANSVEHRDYPVCPYCEHVHDYFSDGDFSSEKESTMMCDKCENEFMVLQIVDISYKTWTKHNEANKVR